MRAGLIKLNAFLSFFLSFSPPDTPFQNYRSLLLFHNSLNDVCRKVCRTIVNYAPRFRSFRVFGIVHNRAGTASTEIKFSNWNLIVGAGGGIRRNRAKHTVIDPASIVRNIIRWTR